MTGLPRAFAHRCASLIRVGRIIAAVLIIVVAQGEAAGSAPTVIAVDGSQSAASLKSVHYTIEQILSDESGVREAHLIVYDQVVEQVVSLGNEPSLMRERAGEALQVRYDQVTEPIASSAGQIADGRVAIALERALAVFDEQAPGGSILVFNAAGGIARLSARDAQWLDIVLLPEAAAANRLFVLIADAPVPADAPLAEPGLAQFARPLILSADGQHLEQLIPLLRDRSLAADTATVVAELASPAMTQPVPAEANPSPESHPSNRTDSAVVSEHSTSAATASHPTAEALSGAEVADAVGVAMPAELPADTPERIVRLPAEALVAIVAVMLSVLGVFVWSRFRRRSSNTAASTATPLPACPIDDESAAYLPLDKSMPRHFGQSAIASAPVQHSTAVDSTAQRADTLINDDDKTVLKPRS